jgi:hypothetical protein
MPHMLGAADNRHNILILVIKKGNIYMPKPKKQ